MKLVDKLDYLMKINGLNKHTLSERCGIPYTTITGMYVRGTDKLQLATLQRLCAYFGVSLDYMALDQYDYPEDFKPNGLRADAKAAELVRLYESLNDDGRQTALVTMRSLASNPELTQSERSPQSAAG